MPIRWHFELIDLLTSSKRPHSANYCCGERYFIIPGLIFAYGYFYPHHDFLHHHKYKPSKTIQAWTFLVQY